MQHDRVAALDIFFQRALPVQAVDHNAKVAVIKRGLAAHQRQVAVRNAGLHAVTLDHEVKIVLRVLDAGIFFAVVLLKGERAVTGADRADDGDQVFAKAGKSVAADRAGDGIFAQAQQGVRRGIQDLGQLGHGLRVRRGAAGLPLANGLLGDAEAVGQLGLAVFLGPAGFFQAFCKHRACSLPWAGQAPRHVSLAPLYNQW